VDASAGVRYVPHNAVDDRSRAKDDLRTLKDARACSAATFPAATVLHDLSQDVNDHIGAGASGKNGSSGDEEIFEPYRTQVTLQEFMKSLHWTDLANSTQRGRFPPKLFDRG
jgi:hypothetical protein